MTRLNNEIRDLRIDELSIEEMETVTGGDSAIVQLAKLAGAAAVYEGGGHFTNIATTLP
jgi:bacteriocin-like protein